MRNSLLVLIFFIVGSYANAQSLVWISPSYATKGQTLNVTISGNKTHFAQASTTMPKFSVAFFHGGAPQTDIIVNSVLALNDTTIIANITISATATVQAFGYSTVDSVDGFLSAGAHFFYVTNSGSKSISLNPSSAAKGQTLNVNITGTNVHFDNAFGANNSLTFFGQASGSTFTTNAITYVSPTQFLASVTVPTTVSSGQYNVSLQTESEGIINLSNGFTVLPGSLSTSSPNVSQRGQTLSVTITGVNTHFNQATTTVSFFKSGSPTSNLIVNFATPQNATTIIANVTIPITALLGTYSLSINNSIDGMLNLNAGLTVQSGTIAAVSPSTAPRGQTLLINITGNGTAFTQGSSTVSFFYSGTSTAINVNSIIVNSSSSLSASITIQPNAIVGTYDVKVFSPLDGTLILYSAFHVTGPSVSSVSPTVLSRGDQLNLTITGSNSHFNQGTGTNISFFTQGSITNYITVDSTKVFGSTNMQAYVSVSRFAPNGTYQLHAFNAADNEMIYGNNITVLAPTINSITPNSSPNNRVLDITITGSGTNFSQASSTNFGFFLTGSPTTAIHIDSIQTINDITANLHVTIAPTAASNYYTLNYTSVYDGTLSSNFIVSPGIPSLLSVVQPFGNRGQTLDVTITGQNTSFMQSSGTNAVSFTQGSGTNITINSVLSLSDNVLKVNMTIDTAAKFGAYTLSVSNNIDGAITKVNAFLISHVGVNELINNYSRLNLYPNPAKEIFTIELNKQDVDVKEILLMDLNGKKIMELHHPSITNDATVQIDTRNFNIPSGTYFIRVISDKQVYYNKILME
jgi:hypothetical protein